ncbi:MAG TPA: thioredoxin domain-containing protein [Bryobacteraceae bacterium]|nr:thioredoxin domain-containing protein [Bryobacteraceae bacterium]
MTRLLLAAVLTFVPGIAAVQHLMEGMAQSPVRVVIYEDLQCPDCAVFRNMLDDTLLPRFASTVSFEHRDFPLAKHAWARKAAIAARFFEEAKPGLGLAYRKYSMANLRTITADNFSDRLSQFASEYGVDATKALAALSDTRLADLVEQDYQEGVARGIAHTPTVLVNGRPFIETFAVEDVAKAIDAELAAAK